MVSSFIGTKIGQTQGFSKDGIRIPVSKVRVTLLPVVALKTKDKDGYSALLVGIGISKRVTKSKLGQLKRIKDKLPVLPQALREIRISDDTKTPNVGDFLKVTDVVKPGDIVDVTGVSKGKGFAGVVKRHHFKGGPRTHGQSDRERAPGSIGQTTTPGRVYKGKRMAGRMGHENVTIKNLTVMGVSDNEIAIKGLVPGTVKSMVVIKKVGENKKFSPLYKEGEQHAA